MGGERAMPADFQGMLEDLDRHVQAIRTAALQLKASSGGIQAIDRNADRVLASTTMLEINISDVLGRERPMAGWTADDEHI